MNFNFAISAAEETTFWQDIWNYLYDVYLRVDGNYENLGLEKMPLFSVRLTVLGIFVGIVIACIAMAYHKQVLGGTVRRIIEKGATSEEAALGVEELGYKKNFLIKNALAHSTALHSVVRCAEKQKFEAEQRADMEAYEAKRAEGAEGARLPAFRMREYIIDADTDRFYIPEELRIRAEIKFEKKGSGWVSTLISIAIVLILFLAVLLVLPQLLVFLDKMAA